MSSELILSIDGGASKTSIGVINIHTDSILQEVKVGPTYYSKSQPNNIFLKNLHKGIKQINTNYQFRAVVVGVAGIDTKIELEGCSKVISQYIQKTLDAPQTFVINDVELVHSFCDYSKELTIAIIAGTGSNCIGQYRGNKAKSGGLGNLLSDQGSGYYIGYNILRSAVKSMDKRGEPTLLDDLVLNKLRVKDLSELKELTSKPNYGKKEIASLAPLILLGLKSKDSVSIKISQAAAIHLYNHVKAVDSQLGTLGQVSTSIVCSGSIFKIEYIKNKFESLVKGHFKNIGITYPTKPPFYGGAYLYKRANSTL